MMNSVYQPLMTDNILDLIWSNSTDAIFVLNYDGSVIDANPAFQNMLGWNTEELNGIAFPPFIANMTKEEHQALISQLKDGQNFPYMIVKRRDKDGAMLDILASYWSVNNKRILAIGMYKNFTEQMEIQKKLEESEYCYRTLVEYLPDAIVKQCNNKIRFVNSSGMEFFGVNKLEDILGYSIWDFVTSEGKGKIQKLFDDVYDNNIRNSPKAIVDHFVRQDGKEIWAEVKVIPIGRRDQPDIQIVFRDVTEKKRYESQLEYLAYHDPLTGLKNRRIFTEIVTESIESAKIAKEKIAIMYIDIDKFKSINDTYGHDVGDQLLQEFAKRLKSCVREFDVLCRVGGDEFLVLLKGIKEVMEIVNVAENMILAFQEPYKMIGSKLHVTSSIGIAVFPENGRDCQTLIYRADKALYRSKEKRNQYMFDGISSGILNKITSN
ncbi:sensor domain-containing diguanylate cyclase [Bacillus sp. JJ1503]|uniref:sensor domain-containing diguanylate cyclase n=1 Tax=Bacillus sp. JJ1503 TaxID=3122956 RepID=UPI002FFE63A3